MHQQALGPTVHTTWGSFWFGWGILQLAVGAHMIPPVLPGSTNPAFAFWFIVLAGQ